MSLIDNSRGRDPWYVDIHLGEESPQRLDLANENGKYVEVFSRPHGIFSDWKKAGTRINVPHEVDRSKTAQKVARWNEEERFAKRESLRREGPDLPKVDDRVSKKNEFSALVESDRIAFARLRADLKDAISVLSQDEGDALNTLRESGWKEFSDIRAKAREAFNKALANSLDEASDVIAAYKREMGAFLERYREALPPLPMLPGEFQIEKRLSEEKLRAQEDARLDPIELKFKGLQDEIVGLVDDYWNRFCEAGYEILECYPLLSDEAFGGWMHFIESQIRKRDHYEALDFNNFDEVFEELPTGRLWYEFNQTPEGEQEAFIDQCREKIYVKYKGAIEALNLHGREANEVPRTCSESQYQAFIELKSQFDQLYVKYHQQIDGIEEDFKDSYKASYRSQMSQLLDRYKEIREGREVASLHSDEGEYEFEEEEDYFSGLPGWKQTLLTSTHQKSDSLDTLFKEAGEAIMGIRLFDRAKGALAKDNALKALFDLEDKAYKEALELENEDGVQPFLNKVREDLRLLTESLPSMTLFERSYTWLTTFDVRNITFGKFAEIVLKVVVWVTSLFPLLVFTLFAVIDACSSKREIEELEIPGTGGAKFGDEKAPKAPREPIWEMQKA